MKKLISLICLFVFSLFIANSQPNITYVDTIKSVSVSISSDSKQNLTLQDLQLQFIKAAGVQAMTNCVMSGSIKDLQSEVNITNQKIEERNKSDSKLITDIFNYTPQEVKQVIRKERRLNFILYILSVFYIVWATSTLSGKYRQSDYFMFYMKMIFYTVYGIVVFLLLRILMSLIFNGDFYVIKELMNLYT